MRRIRMGFVLLGLISAFPSHANDSVEWSADCTTTGLMRWTFDFGKGSTSELKTISMPNAVHMLKVSAGGNVFKNEQKGLSSFYFPMRQAKEEVYIYSSDSEIEISFNSSAFLDAPRVANQLIMSQGHLVAETGLGQFKLNYLPEKKEIIGVQVNSSKRYVHAFECNNVNRVSWSNLFSTIKRMADIRLTQLEPHQIRQSSWRTSK